MRHGPAFMLHACRLRSTSGCYDASKQARRPGKTDQDMATGSRNGFKAMFSPLIWLAGVALIIYYAPLGYQVLRLADGEQVLGFRGQSHDLILTDGPGQGRWPKEDPKQWTRKEREEWIARKVGIASAKAVHGMARHNDNLNLGSGFLDLVSLGHSVWLWNLENNVKERLALDGSPEISRLRVSADGARILIDTGNCIAVFDGKTRRPVQTIKGSSGMLLNTSRDGAIVVMATTLARISCLQAGTGREEYSTPGNSAIVSPNGKYLAISEPVQLRQPYEHFVFNNPCVSAMINLERHTRTGLAGTPSGCFSPTSDQFIDTIGGVWDLASNELLYRLPTCAIFVDDGKKVAWLEDCRNGLVLKLRDVREQRDLPDRAVYVSEPRGSIEAVDLNGNLIRLQATSSAPGLTWLQTIIKRLGFKQTPSEEPHEWLLIDAKTSRILHRGRDELIAVSSDGQYVVSGDHNKRELKLHELPVHRSMTFIAIAGAVWTSLLLAGLLLWRRGLKPLVQDVTAPGQKEPSAVT